MANRDYLLNMECPQCGSEGPFYIEVYGLALVDDDGVQEAFNLRWDDAYACSCQGCGFESDAITFRVYNKDQPASAPDAG